MTKEVTAALPAAHNERGVIADTYQELQAIPLLEQARQASSVEKASADSLLRTVLQAVEIALYNMADLLRRAKVDAEEDDLAGCMTKLAWLRGFQRVLVRLSLVARDQALFRSLSKDETRMLPFAESPGFREYLAALKSFDRTVRRAIDDGRLDPFGVLDADSLASIEFSVLHLARVGNHESQMWERNLLATPAPAALGDYGEFVAAPVLRHAVFERVLRGDTYFTQFRGLHQIPELLTAEINDTLEEAILAIRNGDLPLAALQLLWVNALSQPVEACVPVMVDSLTTHDYHEIRENLGLTSGSHSIGIRYHMFTNLYEQLWEEAAAAEPRAVEDRSLYDMVVAQILMFRSFIFQWRDEHLHLPRNNLGGAGTRSLTGSPDAVQVVEGMREHARTDDPACAWVPLAAGGGRGVLDGYLDEEASLDSALLLATGQVTQSKFTEVQNRTGYFANKSSFSKPPPRRAR